jgi:hypothetical protein
MLKKTVANVWPSSVRERISLHKRDTRRNGVLLDRKTEAQREHLEEQILLP